MSAFIVHVHVQYLHWSNWLIYLLVNYMYTVLYMYEAHLPFLFFSNLSFVTSAILLDILL